MSHFTVLAIVPSPKGSPDLRSYWTALQDEILPKILEPFSENRDCPPRKEQCWCVGGKAAKEVREQLDAELGTHESIRQLFRSQNPNPFNYRTENEKWETRSNEIQALWISEIYEKLFVPRDIRTKEMIAAHPLGNAADPECDDCKGTGLRETTYPEDVYQWIDASGDVRNLSSEETASSIEVDGKEYRRQLVAGAKWDWYVIGGRWQGSLDGYDPYADPKNKQPCIICGGTGTRTDFIYARMKTELSNVSPFSISSPADFDPQTMVIVPWCNGCQGTGQEDRYPSMRDAYPGDVQPICRIDPAFSPFAFLLPDGSWIEKGDMVWWGIVRDEKDQEDWNKQSAAILEKYKEGHHGILLDCHI